MTGRWVDAAEALALGLVSRVDDDPGLVAEGLAGEFAAAGPAWSGSIKLIAAAGGLLEQLRAEREANRAAWGGA